MPSKALDTDICHLWACKVLCFGMFCLLLSRQGSIITQPSADSKVNYTRKGAQGHGCLLSCAICELCFKTISSVRCPSHRYHTFLQCCIFILFSQEGSNLGGDYSLFQTEEFCCRARVALKQVVQEVIDVSSQILIRDGETDYQSASRPLKSASSYHQVGRICIKSSVGALNSD